MGPKNLTPEEQGKNLEEFAELEEEAKRLGSMTKAEVAASIQSSGHDQEEAREIGRRAAEAFAKAKAEEKSVGKRSPILPRPNEPTNPHQQMRWHAPSRGSPRPKHLL
jgi:hypothetical protein